MAEHVAQFLVVEQLDGPAIEEPLRRWMAAEDDHFARNRTDERVDRLVDGVARVGHDPENEYVRLR